MAKCHFPSSKVLGRQRKGRHPRKFWKCYLFVDVCWVYALAHAETRVCVAFLYFKVLGALCCTENE